MAADDVRTPLEPNGATPGERTAADLGASVADEVRRAIESAERAAAEMHSSALAQAAADHDQVEQTANLVLARIDAIEAQVARLLQGARDEVARVAEEANRPEPEPLPVDPPSTAEPSPALEPAAEAASGGAVSEAADEVRPPPPPDTHVPPATRTTRRRGGLLRRRPRAPRPCDVCGRAAEPGRDAFERWQQVARMSLCPECQAEGWQIPPGGKVPFRATRQRAAG